MLALKKTSILLPLLLINHIYAADTAQTRKKITPDTPAMADKEQKVTTVIFDVGGVLFQESRSVIIKKIGVGKLTKYAIFNWTNPETTVLNTLHTISSQETNQPAVPLLLREKRMPCCIVDWQLGHTSHMQAQNELKKQIDILSQKNYFKNSQEKELVLRMFDVGINPQHLPEIMKPVTSMVELAKELKSRNYKLIILANMSQEQYDILHKTYPEITQLFDDIIVSSRVNMLKPNKEIYEHLLITHALKPQECIVVDALKEHIEAAQQKGIRSILHKNARTTRASLAKLGV